ncbi:MAG: SelB C-terminal domain-containing protein [Candidatus Aminicenantales bacterium]
MTMNAFDAALDFPAKEMGGAGRVSLVFAGHTVPAAVVPYKIPRKAGFYALVTPERSVEVLWKDAFLVHSADGKPLGGGVALFPSAPSSDDVKPARRKDLLERLSLGERDMVLALAEVRGIGGLRAEDITRFSRLNPARAEAVARGLEEEGKVRIMSFAPLFLVLQDSLDFLRRRLAAYLSQYHKKHPGQRGAPAERIEKRFDVAPAILQLAVRTLVKEGRVSLDGGLAAIVDFRAPLSAADEKTVGEMETMFLKGEFGQATLDEVRKKFHLSPAKLRSLVAVLAERKKIVEGRDGFILHSRWLDDVVTKIRATGRRELTVADFKALTGLSRKYAIPLLELLDEMGVTRRKGAVRDILK